MSQKVRVTVPETVGTEIKIAYDAAQDPITYKVTEGHVSVEPENVKRFLLCVDGSKVATETTKTEVK